MNKLKQRIESLGLSIKKELLFLFVGNILILFLLIIPYILKSLILVFPIICLVPIYNFVYVYRYKIIERKQIDEDYKELISLLTFFRIYIENGYNVYQSLKEIKSFANQHLNLSLERLIQGIDKDKTVQPFIDFSREFNEIIIEQMMISIYQMVDDGNNSSYFRQFEIIFEKIANLNDMKELENKERKLGTMTVAPLIGSGFLIIMITFGVISIIGEVLNGI